MKWRTAVVVIFFYACFLLAVNFTLMGCGDDQQTLPNGQRGPTQFEPGEDGGTRTTEEGDFPPQPNDLPMGVPYDPSLPCPDGHYVYAERLYTEKEFWKLVGHAYVGDLQRRGLQNWRQSADQFLMFQQRSHLREDPQYQQLFQNVYADFYQWFLEVSEFSKDDAVIQCGSAESEPTRRHYPYGGQLYTEAEYRILEIHGPAGLRSVRRRAVGLSAYYRAWPVYVVGAPIVVPAPHVHFGHCFWIP